MTKNKKENDFFERIDLSLNVLKTAEKLLSLIASSKTLTCLDLRFNNFTANTLEAIRIVSGNIKGLKLYLEPQSLPLPLFDRPNKQEGFLSERLRTNDFPLKMVPKLTKQRSPLRTQINGNFLMTRVNWLIELKILFEGIQGKDRTQEKAVPISILIHTIEEHIHDFVLIEESGYKSTHSEIGLSPYDILDSLKKLSLKVSQISYDEIFSLISQMTHNEEAQTIGNNPKGSDPNVRSSCEHIIETARFNKPDENNGNNNPNGADEKEKEKEREYFKPKTPVKVQRDNANSPLSFSMSAIQMTDSKTFTLSDFGCEFLNKPLTDSAKNLKSSASKSYSLTRIFNYESRKHKEEETVIRKKRAPKISENSYLQDINERKSQDFTVFK